MSATTDAPDLDVAEDDETGWDDGALFDAHVPAYGDVESFYREIEWEDRG